MATKIRPEVSRKNANWISRHRYYELRHFCMQYREWKQAYADIVGSYKGQELKETVSSPTNVVSDPTADAAEKLIFYSDRMQMIERAAEKTDPVLAKYIVEGVTRSMTYDILRLRYNIPCCKDVYYKAFRRFFWILDKERQ